MFFYILFCTFHFTVISLNIHIIDNIKIDIKWCWYCNKYKFQFIAWAAMVLLSFHFCLI